jgi:DNA-binding transcriptional LysR family regulator
MDLYGPPSMHADGSHLDRDGVNARVSLTSLISAVSMHETGLPGFRPPKRLGARLLNRTTRSVAPTDAGMRLLDQLAPAFASITEAVAAVSTFKDRLSGTVRLNLPRLAAHIVLAPLFGRFAQTYPDVHLEVAVDDASTDIVASGFDVGIRPGERLQRDMVAVRHRTFASPSSLRRTTSYHGHPAFTSRPVGATSASGRADHAWREAASVVHRSEARDRGGEPGAGYDANGSGAQTCDQQWAPVYVATAVVGWTTWTADPICSDLCPG